MVYVLLIAMLALFLGGCSSPKSEEEIRREIMQNVLEDFDDDFKAVRDGTFEVDEFKTRHPL